MIEKILLNNMDKKADALIMPIIYSIDQSIELYLKSVIHMLEELAGEIPSNYTSHNIEELKNQMVSKIKSKESKIKGLEKHLKPVSDFIDALYSKIKIKDRNGKCKVKIDFARYPFDTNGDPHFYIEDPDNVVIDIENLKERFLEIRGCLESLYLKYKNEIVSHDFD